MLVQDKNHLLDYDEEADYNRDNGYLSPLLRKSGGDPALTHVSTHDGVQEYLDGIEKASYWR